MRHLLPTVSIAIGGCYSVDVPEEPVEAPAPPVMRPTTIVEDDLDVPPPYIEPVDVEAVFYASVAPMIAGSDGRSGSCGPCHSTSGGIGPGFLEPNPDMLTTMLAYPYLIGDAPETSRLYTKGAHHGVPGLRENEATLVAEWIVLYNDELAKQMGRAGPSPRIEPFLPHLGQNTIDLSVLDPALAGQTITFVVAVAGSVTASLELTEITVRAAPAAGVHLIHPLWVRWEIDDRPRPDAIDSFAGVDQTVRAGEAALLGSGILIFPSYAPRQRLNVVFEKIEAIER